MSVTLSYLIKTNLRYILRDNIILSGGPWKCKPHTGDQRGFLWLLLDFINLHWCSKGLLGETEETEEQSTEQNRFGELRAQRKEDSAHLAFQLQRQQLLS